MSVLGGSVLGTFPYIVILSRHSGCPLITESAEDMYYCSIINIYDQFNVTPVRHAIRRETNQLDLPILRHTSGMIPEMSLIPEMPSF